MKKNRIKLSVLKNNALKLRANFQIPFQLCHYIVSLNDMDKIEWINYLKYQTEHMLRIKGYYKRYPDVEREFNAQLKKDFMLIMGGNS